MFMLGVQKGTNDIYTSLTPFPTPTLPPIPTISYIPPSPTPTIDWNAMPWKTYTNTDGKYSFQYPSDFELHVNEIHGFETNHYSPAKNTIGLDSPLAGVIPSIVITHNEIDPASSTDFYINKYAPCVKDPHIGNQSIPNNTELADGTTFIVYSDIPCGIANTNIAFYKKNNLFYQISIANNLGMEFTGVFLKKFIFTN